MSVRRPNRSERSPPATDETTFYHVQAGPKERNPERGDAEVVQAEQEERVACIAKTEDKDDGDRFQKGADGLGSTSDEVQRFRGSRVQNCLLVCRDAEQDEDDDNAWDDAEREERSVLWVNEEKQRGNQRPTTAPA